MELRTIRFDPETARFALPGDTPISFADPRTAKAAGYIVAPRPGPVCGVITLMSGEPIIVLRRPSVICAVEGTAHRPPPSGRPREARPAEPRKPRERRRA